MSLEPESGNWMRKLIKATRDYFSLVKFSHTIFAMPFALIGFTLAVSGNEYQFSVRLLVLVILCMVFARNAAMGFNRLVDRRFDSLNPRTANREIPAGRISPERAALFVIINTILFIILCRIYKPAYSFPISGSSFNNPGLQPYEKNYLALPFHSGTWTKPGSNWCIYLGYRYF